MSVLDTMSVLAVVSLTVLRLGLPLLGLWLLRELFVRALPAQV